VPDAPADPLIEIIGEAMQRPSSEREGYISAACGDAEARERAMRLLGALERAGDFLDRPSLGAGASAAMVMERPGSTIGRYTLIEQVGEGGFGVVFKAEQREPVQRSVAVKIVKLGMDTRAVVARFEAERQALALMDHPCIAKVLDGGVTDTGRPYFVMDLVRGEPITTYCGAARLSSCERLELFLDVCRAVQHAHTKGVIHRDLKPANILVSETDGRPLPRVIDFGIAKATGAAGLSRRVFTEACQFLGTPEYVSPEQARSQSPDVYVDTRTDVYSLGVVLYELLTGETPLDGAELRSAAWDQMLRMIREVDPPRPSTRVSGRSVAASTAVPDASGLRGDLDWIIMRCLEKDPARRYQTVDGLAADIARHLAGEAVLAAPPSRIYRAKKFIFRHRTAVAASVLIALSLVVGLGLAVWQASVAARERDRTEARRRDAAQIAEFQASQLRDVQPQLMGADLGRDVLAAAGAGMIQAGVNAAEIQSRLDRLSEDLTYANLTDVSLRTLDRSVFARAVSTIEAKFAGQPLNQASLLLSVGDTMRRLGLLEGAGAPLGRAVEIRRRELGDDDPETVRAQAALSALLLEQGKLPEADALAVDVLERSRRTLGPGNVLTIDAMNNLAMLRGRQGKFRESERLARQVLELRERVLGPEHMDTVKARGNLGMSLFPLGRSAEAEPLFRTVVKHMRAALGDDHPDTLIALGNFGACLRLQGKLVEAEGVMREVYERRRRVLGAVHPGSLYSALNLSIVVLAQDRPSDAEPLLEEALAGFRRRLGPDHPWTIEAIGRLVYLRQAQGRGAEAEEAAREALTAGERRFGPTSAQAMMSRFELADTLSRSGRFAEAEALLLEVSRAMTGKPAGPVGMVTAELAELYDAWDKAEPGKGHDREAARWRSPETPRSTAGAHTER
jgi:eukaryotic-like serine/threonine-protein kinase